ncbi:MAG: PilZ domain-containing protein [Oscillospiraceae bacterium]
MIIVSKEYLNTTCHIHAPNNMMIGMGKIIVIEDNYIVVSNTSEGFPPLRFLSYVKLTFNSPAAGYKVILASVSDSQNTAIRLGNLNLLTDDEKRGYFRVHITTPTKIFLCGSSLEVEKQNVSSQANPENEAIPFIDVTIKDMSLGGILIESDAFLQLGQRVVVEIVTRKKSEFLLLSVKRRYRDECDENSLYQYGCNFIEKSNKKLDELCRLILEVQSQVIQKIKNV